MFSKLKVLSLAAFSVLALAGCGSSGDEAIKITIWEDESNKEVVSTLVTEYLQEYKLENPRGVDIEITIQKQAEKSAISKMAQISETGNGPDIAAVTHDTIASGVSGRLLSPITFKEEVKARMTDEAVSAVTYKDEVYGYPINAESMVVFYDKTKINASDLVSFDALKTSGKKICWSLTGDNSFYYTSGLYTDAVIFGEDGKDSTKMDLATTKAVNNVYSFFHDYKDCFIDAIPETALSYVENSIEGACGLVSTPFILAGMKKALGDNLGVCELPKINGESEKAFSGYKAYVVSKYTKYPQIAQDICNYLTSYSAMSDRLNINGYLPACALDTKVGDIDFAEDIKNNATAKVFAAALAESRTMPNIPEMYNVWVPTNNCNTYFSNNYKTITAADVKTKLAEANKTILGTGK